MEGSLDLIRPEDAFRLPLSELRVRTLEAGRSRRELPMPASSLVGRVRELGEVGALLRRPEVRLLTLTGPGGTGKTRLALAAAHRLIGEFRDGAAFVGLTRLVEPDLVGSAIASSLGLREQTGDVRDLLATHLRDQELLLVVDNFERLVAAAGLLVELLEAAPGLKILVTSRAALQVSGEHEFLVPPLALPELEPPPPLAVLSQYDAVALFIRRAKAEQPDFRVDDENAPAVAEICVRLDGLPLAIELAAAWVKLLSPQALLARLGERLSMLTGGARDLPAHQQTLRGTLDWSYELLGEPEQRLFARLAIFDGATIDAVEAVCNADDRFGGTVLGLIGELVNKSLVRSAAGLDGERRFQMLETVREYALAQLRETGEREQLSANHAAYFLRLAEQAAPLLTGPEQRTWYRRLTSEHGNLRATLAWARQADESQMYARLASSLMRFWDVQGYIGEGRRLVAHALSLAPELPSETRAEVLRAAANLAGSQRDFAESQRLFEEYLALSRRRGDDRGAARALAGLGMISSDRGDHLRARELTEEGLELAQRLGDAFGTAVYIGNLGYFALNVGDLAAAAEHFRQALGLSRAKSDEQGIALALENLGFVAIAADRLAEGREHFTASLELAVRLGYKRGIAHGLIGLAQIAVREGAPEPAARLLGAVDALITDDRDIDPYERRLRQSTFAELEQVLGREQLEAARAAGGTMTLEQILATSGSSASALGAR